MKKFYMVANDAGTTQPGARLRLCLLAVAAMLSCLLPSPVALSQTAVNRTPTSFPHLADFGTHTASAEMRYLANWVADSKDNGGRAFVIVDKKNARVHVFDGAARLRGSSPVLLGSARGDDSVPGIGAKPLAAVLPEERTTPAGRFVAERGHNARGEDVVWVDYDEAVSMHRVLTTNPQERRLERLATAAVDDNRISYGCINVPVAFYEAYIRPVFLTRRSIVYVLPDVKPLRQVFGRAYDVATARLAATDR